MTKKRASKKTPAAGESDYARRPFMWLDEAPRPSPAEAYCIRPDFILASWYHDLCNLRLSLSAMSKESHSATQRLALERAAEIANSVRVRIEAAQESGS